MLDLLRRFPRRGWRAAAVLCDGDPPATLPEEVVKLASASEMERAGELDCVLLAFTDRNSPLRLQAAWGALPPAIPIHDGLRLHEQWMGQIPPSLQPTHPLTRSLRAGGPWKRVFDLLVGGLLAIPAVPLVALLALLIRIEGKGSVFYTQERMGKGGRRFRIWKLRSMVPDAERAGAPTMTEPADERVTGVGRYLRRWRLDELPQIWNVLRGDMSLVGPRPERPEILAELEPHLPRIRERLLVPAGMTGWAQVRYGYASGVEHYRQKLGYDLYYVHNRSFLFDLRVLALTVQVVLSGKGVR
jgi:lipopolysaccharide/colanic/teichoic acid biosynthesis glycosyltransferase